MGQQSFFAELQRRHVYKVGVAYAVAGWLLAQVVTQVLPVFDVPPLVQRLLVLILISGFPVVLVLSWMFDVTPGGIVRTGAVTAGDAIPAKSIAVLPFTDLSPAHDQEYFSDGMAEELLNALAKVQDLKVAGRTSSFSFKGKSDDLRSIGQALAVANILEGSVRKQGDRVRITAQLIQVKDGYHLWSEKYDGELTDIFDLQERIARAITDALQVVLVGEPQARLVPAATANPEAYSLYLRATTIFNHRDGPRFAEAIAALDQALLLDPKFARAHSKLAALYSIASNYTATDFAAASAAAEREARLAIELEPQLAESVAVLGLVKSNHRQLKEERGLLERAVALDARDTSANFWLALAYVTAGYSALGIAQLDRTLEIDPLLPNALYWRGSLALFAGDRATARRLLQAAAKGGLIPAYRALAILAHQEGRHDDARANFAHSSNVFFSGMPAGTDKLVADGLFGSAADRANAVVMLKEYLETRPKTVSGGAAWALLVLGEPALALDGARAAPTDNDPLFYRWLWSPFGLPARRLPQFPDFARKVGLTELWDQYGPPDLCRRRAPGDYVFE